MAKIRPQYIQEFNKSFERSPQPKFNKNKVLKMKLKTSHLNTEETGRSFKNNLNKLDQTRDQLLDELNDSSKIEFSNQNSESFEYDTDDNQQNLNQKKLQIFKKITEKSALKNELEDNEGVIVIQRNKTQFMIREKAKRKGKNALELLELKSSIFNKSQQRKKQHRSEINQLDIKMEELDNSEPETEDDINKQQVQQLQDEFNSFQSFNSKSQLRQTLKTESLEQQDQDIYREQSIINKKIIVQQAQIKFSSSKSQLAPSENPIKTSVDRDNQYQSILQENKAIHVFQDADKIKGDSLGDIRNYSNHQIRFTTDSKKEEESQIIDFQQNSYCTQNEGDFSPLMNADIIKIGAFDKKSQNFEKLASDDIIQGNDNDDNKEYEEDNQSVRAKEAWILEIENELEDSSYEQNDEDNDDNYEAQDLNNDQNIEQNWKDLNN
ncbi:UNKNOWN [Stylonychia lemnae]|uniref:Uncharacterized protein n=1 Tax=Stylonychia lemnae TaxID=5949 RepID=A0A077ZQE5_STYLE|nr:UNKNOWN [Stylonychia lemnae]|eukprot:CDW71620.1 UNKNOWN [Stylonychia lemnae]